MCFNKKVLPALCFLLAAACLSAQTVLPLDHTAANVFFVDTTGIVLRLENGTLQRIDLSDGPDGSVIAGQITILKDFGTVQFITQVRDSSAQFVLVNDDTVNVVDTKTGEILRTLKNTRSEKISAAAVSPRDDTLACGFASGLLGITQDLQLSNYELNFLFLAGTQKQKSVGKLLSLEFDTMGAYLMSANARGTATLWETTNFTCTETFNFDASKKIVPHFLPDRKAAIYMKDKNHLAVRDFSGTEKIIEIPGGILALGFTSHENEWAVLTAESLELYDIKSQKHIASMQLPNKAVSFDFLNGMLAVSTVDHKLYIYSTSELSAQLKPVAVQPETPPVEPLPEPVPVEPEPVPSEETTLTPETTPVEPKAETTEPVPEPTTHTSDLETKINDLETRVEKIEQGTTTEKQGSEKQDTGKKRKTKKPADTTDSSEVETSDETLEDTGSQPSGAAASRKKVTDAVELNVEFQTYTKNPYYRGTLNCGLGYFFYQWTAPFYFGVAGDYGIGFPNKKFPHDYYLGENKMHSPYAVDITVTAPIGLYFMPFNNDVAFRTELSAGLLLRRLWNGSTKAAVYTKFHPLAAIDFKFLVEYRYIAGVFGVHYDTSFKHAVTAGLKFMIPIRYKKRGGK